MIEITRLTKRYHKTTRPALDGVTLSIGKGLFGLLGPNGAGKTTLIRILAGLLAPTEGQVLVGSASHRHPEQIRRQVGYLPQMLDMYPGQSVSQLLDYAAVMKGIGGRVERRRETERLLDLLNLSGHARTAFGALSSGMKRRLGIAQALLGSPPVLIVDEPTVGLDPEERVRLRNLFSAYGADHTVILSTHIMADIERICSGVAVLDRGRLRMAGTPEQLAQTAAGKVWTVELSEREFAAWPRTSLVSAERTADGIRCRVLSDWEPFEYAAPARAEFEDGYLLLLRGEPT